MPANSDPIITALAPAPRALAISPEYLIPPSAINGTPFLSAISAQSIIAEN